MLTRLTTFADAHRLSARQALRHPYFKELRDADKRRAKMEATSPEPVPMSPKTEPDDKPVDMVSAVPSVSASVALPAVAVAPPPEKEKSRRQKPSKTTLFGLPPILFKSSAKPVPVQAFFIFFLFCQDEVCELFDRLPRPALTARLAGKSWEAHYPKSSRRGDSNGKDNGNHTGRPTCFHFFY